MGYKPGCFGYAKVDNMAREQWAVQAERAFISRNWLPTPRTRKQIAAKG